MNFKKEGMSVTSDKITKKLNFDECFSDSREVYSDALGHCHFRCSIHYPIYDELRLLLKVWVHANSPEDPPDECSMPTVGPSETEPEWADTLTDPICWKMIQASERCPEEQQAVGNYWIGAEQGIGVDPELVR
jgi:hypothetical protein